MEQTTRILNRRLEANSNGCGSHSVQAIGVEWSPEPCSSVPIRSTWRDAVGKQLTNGIIARRTRQGFYGKEARRVAVSKSKDSRLGIVLRCGCGTSDDVRWMTYSYLPKPGYYCPRCKAIHRGTTEKEENLSRKFNQRLKEAAVKEYV